MRMIHLPGPISGTLGFIAMVFSGSHKTQARRCGFTFKLKLSACARSGTPHMAENALRQDSRAGGAIATPCTAFSFQFKKRLFIMNSTYPCIILVLILLNGCRKDAGFGQAIPFNAKPSTNLKGADLMSCGDTSAFKSNVDLQPLAYLQNCYSCTAVKEVPGLGEIPWIGNCEVYIADSMLQFRFMTYYPYFQELLLREYLTFDYIPIIVDVHTILDHANWVQDPEKSFGSYSRLLDDGDVSDGFWGTDTNCTSYIEITRLDLEDREVEGRFEIHLKMKEQGTNGILYSERINFLNGKFKAEIERY